MTRTLANTVLTVLFIFVSSSAWANNYNADCDVTNIQAQVNLAKAASPDGPHTITVSGTCEENVSVSGLNNLTLTTSTGAVLRANGNIVSAALTLSRSDGFRLENLTVEGANTSTNGGIAIEIRNSVDATFLQCTVQGAKAQALNVANGSNLSIGRKGAAGSGCVIQNNGTGMNIGDGSTVGMFHSTVQNNTGGLGINVVNGSILQLFNSVIQGNSQNGINASNQALVNLQGDDSSTLLVEKNEIANNNNGISLSNGSTLTGSGAHKIHNNTLRGIAAGTNSTVSLSGQSAADRLEIYQNGFQGVMFNGGSGSLGRFTLIRQNNQSPPNPLPPTPLPVLCAVCVYGNVNPIFNEIEIRDDPGHGLWMAGNSFADVRNLVITGNGGDGIHLETASGLLFLPPFGNPPGPSLTNIPNNGTGSVVCADTYSWISGDTTGIGRPIRCTSIK